MEEAKARTRSLSSANLEAEEQQEAKEHAKEVAKEKASRKELHCILRFGDTRVSVKFMVTDATRMQELSEELHYELSAQFEMIEKYTDCIPTFVALVPLWRSKPEAAAEDATMESLQDQPQAVPANSGPLRIYVHHDEDEPPRDYWQGKGASFWEEVGWLRLQSSRAKYGGSAMAKSSALKGQGQQQLGAVAQPTQPQDDFGGFDDFGDFAVSPPVTPSSSATSSKQLSVPTTSAQAHIGLGVFTSENNEPVLGGMSASPLGGAGALRLRPVLSIGAGELQAVFEQNWKAPMQESVLQMQLMPGVTADKLVHSAPGIEPIVKTLLAQKCHLHNVAWSQPGGPGSQSIKAYYMAEMEGTPEKLLMEVIVEGVRMTLTLKAVSPNPQTLLQFAQYVTNHMTDASLAQAI